MFNILGILFFFVIFLFLGGILLIITSVLRLFGRSPWKMHNGTFRQSNPNHTQSHTNSSCNEDISDTNPQQHKKIFSKDEGEYVDFEEIKED